MTSIDLRPLSLGEILDRTFKLYRRHFLLFIGISAIPHILTLAVGLVQILFFQTPLVIDSSGRSRAVMFPDHGVGFTIAVGFVEILVALFVYLFGQGATVLAVSEIYLGRSTSITSAFRRISGEIANLFGVVVMNGLATMAASLLLVIPGIYVGCRLLVCLPAAIVEGRGPRESLSRSWELTRGFAGRSFVLFLLYLVIEIGMGSLIGAVLAVAIFTARNDMAMLRFWMALQQVFTSLLETLVSPLLLIGTALFYFDLRVRKEAFDLQFMMDPTSERHTQGDSSVPSILG